MHDRRERRRARAPVVPRNQHHVGLRLRHTRRNRPHAHLGHELHRYSRVRVRHPQIVNELLQVFDAVYVVMWRRRDQRHPRRRVPHPRNLARHLEARQLPTLTRLCPLRNLNLQLVGVDQIFGRYPKSPRRNLLDRRPLAVAIRQRLVPRGVFAPLARVALALQPVHRDCDRLVRLDAYRTKRHRRRHEPRRDRLDRLNLINRDRLSRHEPKQAAQRHPLNRLIINARRVPLERLVIVVAHRLLQKRHRLRRPQMPLAPLAQMINPTHIKQRVGLAPFRKRPLMPQRNLMRQRRQRRPTHTRRRARKIPVAHHPRDAHRLKKLRAMKAAQRRNTNPAERLQQPLFYRRDVIINRLLHILHIVEPLLIEKLNHRRQRHVRTHGIRAVPQQQRHMHHLARVTHLRHDTRTRAQPRPRQMLIQPRNRQQPRYRRPVRINALVRHDENVRPIGNRLLRRRKHRRETRLKRLARVFTRRQIKRRIELS